jgi:glycerophosphoryl diester phosphodiesterase
MPPHSVADGGAIEVIAHRGYSARAPENTLAAIEAAIGAGADAVEFDLHVTRDGVPVLFHDATLERTTNGSGPIAEHTVDDIRSLDAGSWFGARFAGEPVPSFAEALATIGDRVGRIYPEVKGYGDASDLDVMVDLVLEHGMLEQAVFISMDWGALERMRARLPAVRLGYIVEKASRAAEGLARATGDTLALLDFKASLLLEDPRVARRARDAGVDLAVWTVDDPGEAVRLLELGVRRLTTNRVGDLLAWRSGL